MRGLEQPQAGSDSPGDDAVRTQLARILESTDFEVPTRLRDFLSFVVDETLAGRGSRIKSYLIATTVFGRSTDFDVMNDPVVRIEAGRLRRALERYYLLAGRDDPVLIDIPKGTYAPRISWRGELAPPTSFPIENLPLEEEAQKLATKQPPKWVHRGFVLFAGSLTICLALATAVVHSLTGGGLAVEGAQTPEAVLTVSSFTNLSGPDGSLYAAGISDELLNQLSRFRELKIVRRETTTAEAVEGAGVRYLLEGSVRASGQQLRISARLLDARSSRILWNKVYDRNLRNAADFEVESDIAAKVAMAVAQPYGVIFSPISTVAPLRGPDSADAYLCALSYYNYRKVLSREEHARTRGCLQHTTARFPDYSTGWAMLSQLYLDEDRYDLNRQLAPSGRERALAAAKRAIQLDPANVRGLQALMTVLFFSKEPEAALRVGEKALALNPNDSEMLAELGSRIAQSGRWQQGREMMENALEQNPAQTGYYTGLIAQAYYMEGDNGRALATIERADLNRFSMYHFVAALIFARAGLERETRASVAEFLRLRPRFFENFSEELAMRNFSQRDRDVLIGGARQAGFPVGAIAN